MARRHQNLPTIQRVRDGEGPVIGFARKESAAGGLAIGIDFSTAPVPDRRFPADAAWTDVGPDLVRIVFVQFRGVGPAVEHMVVVRVPFEAARQFIRTMSLPVKATAEGGVADKAGAFLSKIDAAPSPKVDRNVEPKQSFTLDANIIIAGFSNREACLDLYQSSPQVKLALMRGATEFRAEPVTRVTLTTRLLLDVYEELSTAALPADGHDDSIEVEHE